MEQVGEDPEYSVEREGWAAIKCTSKRAYGCGKGGNSAVQDLDLFLHHGDLENRSSFLSVRAGDQVFRWIDEVIADKEDRCFKSKVEIVDQDLIVVTMSFSVYGGLDYYLVFDYVDGSLSMVPYMQDWANCFTRCPLPLRHEDGGYSLVLLGGERGNNFLWRWSPWLDGSSSAGSSGPWLTKGLRFPAEMKDKLFCPSVLFSCKDTAFWTDLALGTLYCDCSALLGEGDGVDFNFIGLPPGHQVDRYDDDVWPVEVYRTMACTGGSLRFVSIDKPCDERGTRVNVWTLEPSSFEWKLYKDFRLKKLWKDFKRAGLPRTLPTYPMFREEEGSTLYFILSSQETQSMDWCNKYYLCRFDMPTKTLLESKLLAHNSLDINPVILPPWFFEYLDPLPSRTESILMED